MSRFAKPVGRTLLLLLCATLAAAPSLRAQRTQVRVGMSLGVFDGFGIGLMRYAHGGVGVRGTVVLGSAAPGYVGDLRYGRGYDDRRYADYCWDRAWDLRWGRGYYGRDWGFPTYDHLDFYHDCLSSGIDYAYHRWSSHARRDGFDRGWYDRGWGDPWYGDPWCEWSCGRGGVTVSVYVAIPFWRPWGPYWAYDPWGWYERGFRTRGFEPYGRVVFGGRPIVRTAWVENGRGWTHASPIASPRFGGDGDRHAVPRGSGAPVGRVVDPSPRVADATRRPSGAAGERTARPRTGAADTERGAIQGDQGRTGRSRPSDALRGRGRTDDGPRARSRYGSPADGGYEPRARGSETRRGDAPSNDGGRTAPSERSRGGHGEGGPTTPSERSRRGYGHGDRPTPSEESRGSGDERSAPESSRTGGERDGARDDGGERAPSAPSRDQGSSRGGSARSGGGSRSGGSRSGGSRSSGRSARGR